MRIRGFCEQCQNNSIAELIDVELTNNNLYKFTCKNGHTTNILLKNLKFEILFDIAISAFLDGYPREAIATASSALERFYEFYIYIICIKNNIPQELFNKTWNEISKQSERQYGAFLFLYLIDNPSNCEPLTIYNKSPKKNKKSWSSFRNKVIHEGYIPTRKDSYIYLAFIYKHICQLITKLKINNEEYIFKATLKSEPNINTQISIETIFKINRMKEYPISLAQAIKAYHTWEEKHKKQVTISILNY